MSTRQAWLAFLGALASAGAVFAASWFYNHQGPFVHVWALDFWFPVILLAIVPLGMAAYGGHVAADAHSDKRHRLQVKFTFWGIGVFGLLIAFAYQYRTMKTDAERQTATQSWEDNVNHKLDAITTQPSSAETKQIVVELTLVQISF